MSRAFMKENDGMFHCRKKDRDCPDANLRGGCDLERCRHEDEMSNAPAVTGSDRKPDSDK